MKSEHRHELKTNELAEWLSNFPQWARENRTTIIYVSVLTVVVAGLYIWKFYSKNIISVREHLKLTKLITQLPQSKQQILRAQTQGIDISYTLIQTADDLQAAGRSAKDNAAAALALIKRAEALRIELHYRPGTAMPQEIADQIDRAKASYAEAFTRASEPLSSASPSLMAAAKFGMGLCEEELGNFEEARQIYSGITENTLFEGTTAVIEAKLRLETMAEYQQKVVFKAPPIKSVAKPAPAEPIQSQIKIVPPDINLPG